LDDKQSCNLTSINLMEHIFKDENTGKYLVDYLKLSQTAYLVTRVGSRQTLADQWHPEWDKVQKRDRLLGVDITGVVDALDLLGWNEFETRLFYQALSKTIREAADIYHKHLGIPRSARVTLVKPNGTLSKLPGVSAGISRGYAPYQICRIRFSKSDPLATALYEAGMIPTPENSQGSDYYPDLSEEAYYTDLGSLYNNLMSYKEYTDVRNKRLSMSNEELLFSEECTTWVFKFGVKGATPIRAIDESALVQLERYKLIQNNYTKDGHNTSNTITVADHEWEDVTKWLYDNWDYVIGLALLKRFDPNSPECSHPQMPNEACTKEEYDEIKKSIPTLNEAQLLTLLQQYEVNEELHDLEADCQGSCPVR